MSTVGSYQIIAIASADGVMGFRLEYSPDAWNKKPWENLGEVWMKSPGGYAHPQACYDRLRTVAEQHHTDLIGGELAMHLSRAPVTFGFGRIGKEATQRMVERG